MGRLARVGVHQQGDDLREDCESDKEYMYVYECRESRRQVERERDRERERERANGTMLAYLSIAPNSVHFLLSQKILE